MNTDQMSVRELEVCAALLVEDISAVESKLAGMRDKLGRCRKELARRTRPAKEPRVSDHALLRYIERIYGVDVEKLRSDILSETTRSAIKCGASSVKMDGVVLKIADGVVTTIYAKAGSG